MKEFLERGIDILRTERVRYGDIRVVETEVESIKVRNGIVEGITHSYDSGFGVRVLKDKGWGFSSSARLAKREQDRVVREALGIARASSSANSEGVHLSYLNPQIGFYETEVKRDPFKISVEEKISLLLELDKILRAHPDIKVSQCFLTFFKTRKYFASTEGSYTDQKIIESGGGITCFAIKGNEVQCRSYPCAFGNFAQKGYEFIEEMGLLQNAEKTREEALMLLSARPCPDMETTVVLDSNQMALQVHESCGHPSELDRVLGTEESYAGGSFLTLEKLRRYRYGSPIVNINADATLKGGLGTFGFDDEGVPAQKFFIVKEGIFSNYLTSRQTASIIKSRSNGTMRADGWARIPLIRMTNINLLPQDKSFEELISEVKDGIYMETNKSWSIDNKRLNFQFGTEIAWRIRNGKLREVYKNPIYTGITPLFWGNCDGIGNRQTLWGLPNCGKGEPGQSAHVGHATPPARFKKVRVGGAKA